MGLREQPSFLLRREAFLRMSEVRIGRLICDTFAARVGSVECGRRMRRLHPAVRRANKFLAEISGRVGLLRAAAPLQLRDNVVDEIGHRPWRHVFREAPCLIVIIFDLRRYPARFAKLVRKLSPGAARRQVIATSWRKIPPTA